MSRLVTWIIGLALIVGAGVVVALEPNEQVRQAPFIVEVPLGQEGVGRNIQVEFTDVRLADALDLDGELATTNGIWLVVDLVAVNRTEPTGMQSFLLLDGLEFRGSERLEYGIESDILVPGIPTSGSIFFEIPRELAANATSARVLIGTNGDWRLDSAIGLTVNPSELTPEPETTPTPATREAP